MSSSWVTLAAAVIAAVAAVFNVIVTKRSTSNVELQKWRRQQVGELGARVIATVHAFVSTWQEVLVGRVIMSRVSDETLERARGEVSTASTRLHDLMDTVELAVAELDLVAGRPVLQYTSRLLSVLGKWKVDAVDVSDEAVDVRREMALDVHATLFDLIDVMRADLGIEKRVTFRVPAEYRDESLADW